MMAAWCMLCVQPPTACADEGMFSYVPNAAAFGDVHHSSSEIILPDNDIFTLSVSLLRCLFVQFVKTSVHVSRDFM